MTAAHLGATVTRVLDRVHSHADAEHADSELLHRWEADRDEQAFATLVRRHGGLVLGVCRRVLRDAHAAEDAFQAVFLVLARKADAVRPPGVLGPWLLGVAYRTALKARGREFRRREVERDYADVASRRTAAPPEDPHADLRAVIDEQMNALPEKYRVPLVLCAMQGLGKAEAAERLGLPEGTISSRLARAREMLRDRLTRRGVVVPAAVLAAVLTPGALRAAVPTTLTVATAETALGTLSTGPDVLILLNEVLRTMTTTHWKLAAAIAFAIAVTGGGIGLYATQADDKKPAAQPDQPKPAGEKPATGEKPKPAGEKPGAGEKPKPEGEKPAKPKPPGDGEKPRPTPVKLAGKVGSVDPKANTITLVFQGDSGTKEKTIQLAATTRITIDGKLATLDAVKPGTFAGFAAISKDGQQPEIVEVRVTGANVVGIVSAVTADSITVNIGGNESGAQPKVIKITASTRIQVGGVKEPKLTDIKVGNKASVMLTTDGTAAIQVMTGSREGEGGDKPKPGTGDKPGVKKPGEGDKPGVKKPGEGDKKPE